MALITKHIPFTGSGDTAITRLSAWHVKESTGAAEAVVNIRMTDASGAIVIPLHLVAGEAVGENYAHPLLASDSWYVEVVSGAVVGSLSGE